MQKEFIYALQSGNCEDSLEASKLEYIVRTFISRELFQDVWLLSDCHCEEFK